MTRNADIPDDPYLDNDDELDWDDLEDEEDEEALEDVDFTPIEGEEPEEDATN